MSEYSLQRNIAHALEKTKYPDSDIYWRKFDEKYHFSCQFISDIIAMNNADFIINTLDVSRSVLQIFITLRAYLGLECCWFDEHHGTWQVLLSPFPPC
jgi:hypothetical protein